MKVQGTSPFGGAQLFTQELVELAEANGVPIASTQDRTRGDYMCVLTPSMLETVAATLPADVLDREESDDGLGTLVKFVADVVRRGCGQTTASSDIADYPALLSAFEVTDRGSLTRAINRLLSMPPGIGIEFYAQPLENGDWDTWIGAGGQGNGFNFPTSIAVTLECAREAFDDYVGDPYRDLKFDTDWNPRESHAAPSDAGDLRRDAVEMSGIGRLITIAHSVDPQFARACLKAIEDFSAATDLVLKLLEDVGYQVEDIEDELYDEHDHRSDSEIARIRIDHDIWSEVRDQLQKLANYGKAERIRKTSPVAYPVDLKVPGTKSDRERPQV